MLPNTLTSEIAPPHPTISPPEYAPAPPLHRTRRFRRLLLIVALLAIVAASLRWGRDIASRAVLLYHQRACRLYTAPPDQIVFSSNPSDIAALSNDPDYVTVGASLFRNPPSDWVALQAALPSRWPPNTQLPILFLHELRSANGVRSIVVLERIPGSDESAPFISGYDVMPRVINPAGFKTPLSEIPESYQISIINNVGPHANIGIFACQLDPAD